MEITISHDQSGSLKLLAQVRLRGEDIGDAQQTLESILTSIEDQMDSLWAMEIDPGAKVRTMEVRELPNDMTIN